MPATNSGSSVDCSTWSRWLNGNGTQAPISYSIQNISTIFSAYRRAFTSTYPCANGLSAATSPTVCFTQRDLIVLTNLVSSYMTNCAPNPGQCVSTPAAMLGKPGGLPSILLCYLLLCFVPSVIFLSFFLTSQVLWHRLQQYYWNDKLQ